ncbi:hypothetical protein SAMN03097699_0860 [Flavobacteriaceae bacterium MAR_2010_188]|nr:hypothetical protein SAMN03097699_0860 [Flavobacteriaceae bacterium MAR_2010_188]
MKYSVVIIFTLLAIQFGYAQQDAELKKNNMISEFGYNELVELFKEWRAFEKPPLKDGASDYTKEAFVNRQPKFENLQQKLKSIDTTAWSIHDKADYMVVWAEMNGYDFNRRILKPWERDPAFYKVLWSYQSDVPAHEGPTNHSAVELWKYKFPLSKEDGKKLAQELSAIKPLYEQAKLNLTGNAKDLWITGIRDIREQEEALIRLKDDSSVKKNSDLIKVIDNSISSTQDLIQWLTDESKTKTGQSGIGKENYTWYNKNVRLVPLSWDDEVMLLKRELARAWSSLKLEEHRNRNLPQLEAADSPEAYNKMADSAVNSMITFLNEQDIVTVQPYFKPALVENKGEFVPVEKRNFFLIGEHYDPRPLYSHFYHWFELARMVNEPNPSEIRKGPLLYNIFDSRNEGTATAVEEMFMHAGLYDDSPRTREIVYIMIAQRAARGLGSLYAQANEMTMEEAGGIHSEFTPRGWMKTEKELLIFEQHLYLRQPGYGTSYIVGKYLLESAMAEFARQKELNNEPFNLKDFFDTLNSIGNIPISLGHWEMTGSQINKE